MSQRVQQLIHEVRRAAEKPEHSPALSARFPGAGAQPLDALKREIVEEIAYSLGRAGRRVQRSLDVLNGLLERLRREPLSAEELRQAYTVFDRERDLARQYLRDLLIQREALGFRHHEEVHRAYPIPRWELPRPELLPSGVHERQTQP